jgi:hypothetical protein
MSAVRSGIIAKFAMRPPCYGWWAGLPEDLVRVLPNRRRLGTDAVERYACGPTTMAGPPAPGADSAGRSYVPIGIEVDTRAPARQLAFCLS